MRPEKAADCAGRPAFQRHPCLPPALPGQLPGRSCPFTRLDSIARKPVRGDFLNGYGRTVLPCPRMARPPYRRLLGYLAPYDPHVASLALALRELVLEEAPEAIESIAKGYAVAIGFSFTGKPMKDGFCHVVAYATHVNLGFNRGVELPDPA